MLALQVSIGALNDAVDAAVDAAEKPGKPIPQGLASRRSAIVLAVGGAAAGLALSAASGVPVALVGLVGLALGYVYDLRLSRTPLSWLPLALALPILPVYAWLGAVGGIPVGLLALLPIGFVAGAGLAISNGLVDVERDRAAGIRTIAVALGPARAWLGQAVLLGVAVLAVAVAAPVVAAHPGSSAGQGDDLDSALALVRLVGIVAGAGFAALGASLLRSTSASVRERGWELEAVAVAGLGIGWIAAIAGSGAV